jgi:hypothetical protein
MSNNLLISIPESLIALDKLQELYLDLNWLPKKPAKWLQTFGETHGLVYSPQKNLWQIK